MSLKPARIPAIAIETLVTEALRKEQGAHRQTGSQDQNGGDDGHLVETMLEHVDVYENRIVLTLTPDDRGDNPDASPESSNGWANAETNSAGMEHDDGFARAERLQPNPRRIIVHCTLGQQPLVKEVIASRAINDATASAPSLPNAQRRNRARLIETIHRARGWFDELHTGKTESLEIIATREGRSIRNVSMMLNLAFLAPEIIESILKDDMPGNLSASHIAQNLPLDWNDQQKWIAAQA